MIQNISLLHYLTEATYGKICDKLGLDFKPSRIGENHAEFPGQSISKIHLFNMAFKQFGHVWYMHVAVDFPVFGCAYADFEDRLYARYNALFGTDILSDFPDYDQLNCDYIDYANVIEADDAEATIAALAAGGCVPEQLDKALWDQYKKPHGTIEFCLTAADRTHIETLARCHGTALKKRLPEIYAHRATGITPVAAVNEATEEAILGWLREKYNI